jgi:hypothetical protein
MEKSLELQYGRMPCVQYIAFKRILKSRTKEPLGFKINARIKTLGNSSSNPELRPVLNAHTPTNLERSIPFLLSWLPPPAPSASQLLAYAFLRSTKLI